MTLLTERIRTLDEIRAFIAGNEASDLRPGPRDGLGVDGTHAGPVPPPLRPARRTGQRRKPRPGGRPGFMRVDTAHDGGRKGEKGTRVIATVYEVTQFQEFAVSLITEYFMVPVLEALVGAFPFRVLGVARRQRVSTHRPSCRSDARQAAHRGAQQVPAPWPLRATGICAGGAQGLAASRDACQIDARQPPAVPHPGPRRGECTCPGRALRSRP